MNPLNIYGKSKVEAERIVLGTFPDALVIRSSSFFGPWDKYNFIKKVTDALRFDQKFKVADDIIMSPTYVPDLVNVSLDLLIDNEKGIWHLTNEGSISWSDLAITVAGKAGLNAGLLQICRSADMGWKATRPSYSVLKSNHGKMMPSLKNAINRFFDEIKKGSEEKVAS